MFDWVVLKQEVMCDIQLTQMSCSCLRRTKQAHRGQQNVPTYRVGSVGQGYFLFYKKHGVELDVLSCRSTDGSA